jgi:TRAP-type C4-dicarboxylate transport system substrate-binding protein
MKHLFSAVAAAALFGLGLSAPAQAAEFTLRFATINAEKTASYDDVLVPFCRSIEQDSGGRIEIALKPVGGYGKPAELFGLVEKGDIEIASTVQGYSPGRFPRSSVMELPLMFDNSISGTRALMGLYNEGLIADDYKTVHVLALYMLPPYPIFTTGKKIQSVRDFRGLRIRTASITGGLAFAKLGAIPLGIPNNLVGETLENGIIDAMAYGWDSARTTRGFKDKYLIEQVSTALNEPFGSPALMVVMNKAKWDALPADLKAVIEKHAPDLIEANAKLREQMEAASRKKIEADPHFTSLTLSPEQHDNLQRIIAPAIDEWKAGMAKQGIDGDKLLKRARELVQQSKVASK